MSGSADTSPVMFRAVPLVALLLCACSQTPNETPTPTAEQDPTPNEGSGGQESTPETEPPLIKESQSPFAGAVSLQDGEVGFRHTSYSLDANHSLATQDDSQIVTTTWPVKIIENDLVRVTVLAEYGGRILSIIYKPTNHELLYQNSVGTPFGDEAGNFYYDWLMVYGGIFPTFPEPEHGKTWLLPFSTEILADGGDEVAIRMSYQDTLPPEGNVPPERFWYGRTDLRVSATVRVRRGSSRVDFEIDVENTKNEALSYEYWTCTTLTPGSTPGDTYSPRNTEMIVPIDTVSSFYDWVPEVAESRGEGLYAWNRLAHFGEWKAPGILYAEPRVTQDYWGVINHDNEVGIFRVAEADATPGLKFWTWGAESVDIDRSQPHDHRAYIELWAGHSPRFFEPAELGPRETKSWTESYLPTLGLKHADAVNEVIAADFWVEESGSDQSLVFALFSTTPGVPLTVSLHQSDAQERLFTQEWTAEAEKASEFRVAHPQAGVNLKVESMSGELLFETEFRP